MATCQTHKIDSNITGLRVAEEECIGQLPVATPAVAASGVLLFSDQPTDGETITLGSTTLTFVDAGPGAGEILIGLTLADTVTATATAIDALAEFTATPEDGTEVQVGAATAGAAGNSLATTSTAVNAVFANSTLTGGVDATGGPVWEPLEPNSYGDWGGGLTTVARNPINPNRQRQKGVLTDLEASGSMTQDLTQENAQQLLQGFLFADFRTKSSYLVTGVVGDLSVSVAGDFATVVSSALDFTTLGIVPGEWIFIGGDTAASQFDVDDNNGFKRVRSVAANALVLDKSAAPMADDAGTGKQIALYLGRVLKNESDPALIKRRTYQFERTLGSLDGLTPPQSEYLVGAVPGEMTLNLTNAEIVTVDYSFTALDAEQRTQAEGLKDGTRPDLVSADAFNTTSDLHRINISLAGGVDEAPTPLFGFATEASVTINNTLSANKALGVLGAFDVTAGNFVVSGSVTAYFSDIEAVRAVRQNADVTLDMIFVKDNAGIALDMPLIALGDGRPNVELDQPIMLPLTAEAAAGAKIDPALNHTLLITVFDTLPDSAAY